MIRVPRSLLPLIVFLSGFLFAFLLLQNLPFTFGDDLGIIAIAQRHSWRELLKSFLSPSTPAWFLLRSDLSSTSTRIVQTMLFKLLDQSFGLNPNAFWLLQELALGGLGLLTYLLLSEASRGKILPLAGAFFLYALPPVYQSVSWISDLEIVSLFFVTASFYVFLKFYRSKNGKINQMGQAILFFILAWTGMKVKETARIIPIVISLFLLLHQKGNFLKWLKQDLANKVIVLMLFVLLATMVPWRNMMPSAAANQSASLHLESSSIAVLAENLTKLFAFPLVFLTLVSFTAFFWKLKSRNSQLPQWPRDVILFLGVWTAVCFMASLSGFSLKGQLRYLVTLLVPLTAFFFALLDRPFIACWNFSRLFMKLLLATLLMSLVFVQIFIEGGRVKIESKLDEIAFIRNYFDGTDVADFLLMKKVYEDRFHIPNASWQEIYDFFHGRPPAHYGEFGGIRVKEWDPNADASPEQLSKIAYVWGTAYVLSFNEGLYAGNSQIQLIWRSNTDVHSLYSTLIGKVKRKAYRQIFLYRYSPLPAPSGAHISAAG